MTQIDPALHQRAVAIADRAMRELVETECVKADEHGVMWAPLPCPGCGGAEHFACMGQAVREAVDWLTQRGLGEVVETEDGRAETLLLWEGIEA